ncbi:MULTISPECIES: GNAT family N-acetyltransferase [unclassified Methanoculleus]|uniref:GNAT family N-acetyltransferase n=1 Tax=unclassified Methanoculleus TaxID=2619537 RepID=UPI0025F24046|nr:MULTISPECIES: GNAT family N-acetyltransferase [unclassified Methanoculleus]MCK9317918.1 GNAT family N-acetyltransferase [Methanoculleus sp.]MDD2253708.1 GNAT family N-acetyltransferase [Methanoculleus sp.]MDD2788158.1 GNAT family N-acetyltransferase [Methanoculleus sp.]MDD3216981.1 GNAT family N-acetyltransferase [Methanoculleus sp.]MDD4314491.1 GNAT family N-acetyltransferase [Methanoculleus sp.]
MDVNVRGYRDADYPAVCDLERENSPEGCKPEVFIRQAGVLFADTFLVAECAGAIAGYTIGALVQHRPETGWILRLVVSGENRRRGFGESLVAAVIGGLRERGAGEVYLSVAPENHAARTLYEKWGFREAGFCPAYFGEEGARFVLRRDLTAGRLNPFELR